jgi:putative aldouronate transport system substrate-binding protein
MPATTLTVEEGERNSTLLNEVNTYVSEMTLKFIIGDESFDNYDAFLSKMKELGVDEVLKIQQDALDRYNAR